jgi:hypothetical protein
MLPQRACAARGQHHAVGFKGDRLIIPALAIRNARDGSIRKNSVIPALSIYHIVIPAKAGIQKFPSL